MKQTTTGFRNQDLTLAKSKFLSLGDFKCLNFTAEAMLIYQVWS